MLEILTIIILVALQFEYVCSSSKNRHEKSNKEVISFAMLDACSQGMLSTNKLMKDLVIDGTRIYINMKTVNGQERQSTHILDYHHHIQKRKYLWREVKWRHQPS